MAITKEEWEKIKQELSHPWGRVKLKCDEYEVTLAVERKTALTYTISVYVNGWMKGEWITKKTEEARRFFYPEQKFVFPKKHRDAMIKLYGGKRCSKAKLADINRKFAILLPHWSSVAALKKHFLANSKEVTLISSGYGGSKDKEAETLTTLEEHEQ